MNILNARITIATSTLLFCLLLLGSRVSGQQQGKILFSWWDYDLYVINVDGSGETLLATGTVAHEARWSPDGTKIAYSGGPDETDTEIFVMNADGTNQVRLTDNTAIDTDPAWSPDGTRIVFTSNRDGNTEIHVMNADGSNPVNLTNNPAREAYPSWSPDGARIVFASDRDGNAELYVMNADGTNQVRLTNDPAGDFNPSWSPDGAAIAFRRIPVDPSCERVYRINPDGTNLMQLTGEVCDLAEISWLPDSSRVLYQHHSDIYAVAPDGSSQELYAQLPDVGPVGRFDLYLPPTPTPSDTPTFTPTFTATHTPTNTPTATLTPTVTPTQIPCGRNDLPNIPHLSSALLCLYKMWLIDHTQALTYAASSNMGIDSSNRVLVTFTMQDISAADALELAIPTFGGTVYARFQQWVDAWMPIDSLDDAAVLSGVISIWQALPPTPL